MFSCLFYTCLLIWGNLNNKNLPQNFSLKVEITGFRNDKGMARMVLFNSEKGFYKDLSKAYASAGASIVHGTAIYEFPNLPTGKYALTAVHDENNNLKLDTNVLGIPTEGIAVSNNAIGLFWQIKSFDEASVVVKANTITSFKVVY